jgi:hypothetical protein
MKTITKEPPSDKSQQFKDGVLWADCLQLLCDDDVLLATEDKAFYADREYKKGPAKNLLAESKGKAGKLTLVPSTADLLRHIRTDFAIDDAWLAPALLELRKADSSGFLSRRGTEIARTPMVQTCLFATEDPDLIYFTCDMEIPCNDLSGEGRKDMRLSVGGTGTLRLDPRGIVQYQVGGETLSFTKLDGTEGRMSSIYGIGNIVLGHRTVEHTVRYRLATSQSTDDTD